MRPRYQYAILVFITTVLCSGLKAQSQENNEPAETIDESLIRIERQIDLWQSGQFDRDRQLGEIRAWERLKAILKSDPDDSLRTRVARDMLPLGEFLGEHDLAIAEFYLGQEHGGVRGARSRLEHIVQEFPRYSKMDRVLLRLAETYVREDNPDPARNYLFKLICKYPASDYSTRAFDRLNQIGFGSWEGCDKYKE